MPKLSTARETLERVNHLIEAEANPKYRKWIEVNRDHWWGEVIGDVDLVMSTMSHGPIRYTYDGHGFMLPDGDIISSINDHASTRRMYEGFAQHNTVPAGPMDDERFYFNDQGMFVYCILTIISPGIIIRGYDKDVDPNQLYLIRFPNLTTFTFDEHDLMMGEDIVNGAPLLVKPVRPEQVPLLLDGPVDVLLRD